MWITEDFGQTFRQAHEFVKAFHWVLDDHHHRLLVHRNEPNGLGSIIYSNSLFRNRVSEVYATNIKDFYKKGDYLFTTKNNSKVSLLTSTTFVLVTAQCLVWDWSKKAALLANHKLINVFFV